MEFHYILYMYHMYMHCESWFAIHIAVAYLPKSLLYYNAKAFPKCYYAVRNSKQKQQKYIVMCSINLVKYSNYYS